MLSYQHDYHAGNHADVLKHLVLIALLQKLTIKPKPLFFLDTHAGAGHYDLSSEKNTLNAEFSEGVNRFLAHPSATDLPSLSFYKNLVNTYADKAQYPGSPLVAAQVLREIDNAHAAELHPSVVSELKRNLWQSNVSAHHRDGFEALKAFMPPKPNRGMVLIDPPYEQASEYEEVVTAISGALKKWSNGCFMLWYPLLSPTRQAKQYQGRHHEDNSGEQITENKKSGMSETMIQNIAELPVKSVLSIELCTQNPSPEVGMYGSGICIVNPPWQLDEDLNILNEVLTDIFAQGSEQLCRVRWLKTEA